MDELSMVVGAVLSTLTGGTLKMALAPTDAVAELWKERIKARLTKVAATPDHSDAGAPWLAQIGRLSSLQLRIHYIFYRAVFRFVCENDLDLESHKYLELFLPASTLAVALEVSDPVASSVIASSLGWLEREDLLKMENRVRNGEQIRRSGDRRTTYYQAPEDGIVFQATGHGIEFFLWGCGYPYHNVRILRAVPAELIEFDPPIPVCTGRKLQELPHNVNRSRGGSQ
jgi:hypothetical protein